jgi:hypothetical protein
MIGESESESECDLTILPYEPSHIRRGTIAAAFPRSALNNSTSCELRAISMIAVLQKSRNSIVSLTIEETNSLLRLLHLYRIYLVSTTPIFYLLTIHLLSLRNPNQYFYSFR